MSEKEIKITGDQSRIRDYPDRNFVKITLKSPRDLRIFTLIWALMKNYQLELVRKTSED